MRGPGHWQSGSRRERGDSRAELSYIVPTGSGHSTKYLP